MKSRGSCIRTRDTGLRDRSKADICLANELQDTVKELGVGTTKTSTSLLIQNGVRTRSSDKHDVRRVAKMAGNDLTIPKNEILCNRSSMNARNAYKVIYLDL
jgi:hypothetical protein